ncbi:hypothetical protein CDAR_469361 [Caerostris darwini]|uniref:Uncharacterized protein n=1 Tax=Caerostris darwini TaxID=1538125 RepID=A0AAV4QUR8_9ARAC|nr:hypothetical protein CDAR_469361 [Caerostris darwini]
MSLWVSTEHRIYCPSPVAKLPYTFSDNNTHINNKNKTNCVSKSNYVLCNLLITTNGTPMRPSHIQSLLAWKEDYKFLTQSNFVNKVQHLPSESRN